MRNGVTKTYTQARSGRPGPATNYREILTSHVSVHPDIALDRVAYDAASDGCFPLISNDRDLSEAQILRAYRYQPNLERRHHLLKSVQDAAPVLLHNPARIEALFCCQFLALLISALIEREVRNAMRQAPLDNIPLYPEFRDCKAPSAERNLEIFAALARHQLHRDGALGQTFQPELTAQQQQILDLLGLTHSAYTSRRNRGKPHARHAERQLNDILRRATACGALTDADRDLLLDLAHALTGSALRCDEGELGSRRLRWRKMVSGDHALAARMVRRHAADALDKVSGLGWA